MKPIKSPEIHTLKPLRKWPKSWPDRDSLPESPKSIILLDATAILHTNNPILSSWIDSKKHNTAPSPANDLSEIILYYAKKGCMVVLPEMVRSECTSSTADVDVSDIRDEYNGEGHHFYNVNSALIKAFNTAIHDDNPHAWQTLFSTHASGPVEITSHLKRIGNNYREIKQNYEDEELFAKEKKRLITPLLDYELALFGTVRGKDYGEIGLVHDAVALQNAFPDVPLYIVSEDRNVPALAKSAGLHGRVITIAQLIYDSYKSGHFPALGLKPFIDDITSVDKKHPIPGQLFNFSDLDNTTLYFFNDREIDASHPTPTFREIAASITKEDTHQLPDTRVNAYIAHTPDMPKTSDRNQA